MAFHRINSIDDLIDHFKNAPIPDNQKNIFLGQLQNINDTNYPLVIKSLKTLKFTDDDERRIFRYSNGFLKHTNKLGTLKRYLAQTIRPYYLITKTELDNIKEPTYITKSEGIIIPAYYNGQNIIYEEDSKYFIYSSSVLITPAIFDAVSKLSNYKISSDDITTLVKLINPSTNTIIVKEGNFYKIYNISSEIIELQNPMLDKYITSMIKLDEIKQPYEKGFMINNDGTLNSTFIKLINNSSYIFALNQLMGTKFQEGSTDVYKRLNLTICNIPSIILNVDANEKVTDAQDNANSIKQILSCKDKFASIGISLNVDLGPRIQKHQLVIIINTITGRGFLFDSSYTTGEFIPMYKNIILYLRKRLAVSYPELVIKSISDFGCLYPYSLQITPNDAYCLTWSLYITVLFMLNEDKDFEWLVDYLFKLGRDGIRVIVPRFIMWEYGDIIDDLLELDIVFKN